MADPIIATVTEPPRTPRPTLCIALMESRCGACGWIVFGDPTTNTLTAYQTPLTKVTIPGTLESERAARIEKARQDVIRLAGACAGTYAPLAPLRAALAALTAAESEGSSNG